MLSVNRTCADTYNKSIHPSVCWLGVNRINQNKNYRKHKRNIIHFEPLSTTPPHNDQNPSMFTRDKTRKLLRQSGRPPSDLLLLLLPLWWWMIYQKWSKGRFIQGHVKELFGTWVVVVVGPSAHWFDKEHISRSFTAQQSIPYASLIH